MNYEEKTLDCLILGILRQDPNCNLTYISEELKLPKTEIIKHIRYLILLFHHGISYLLLRKDFRHMIYHR